MADIEKRGYKIYANWRNWVKLLTTEQKAYWVDWVLDYINQEEKEIPNNDQALAMAINMTKNALDVDMAFYLKKENAGKKGGITTQLKQRKTKSSTLKQNEAEESTNKQVKADMIRQDKISKDMISNDMVCNDISSNNNMDEDEKEKTKTLIRDLEEMFGRNLTGDEAIIITDFSKTMSNETILRDIKMYKENNIKYPISYMKTLVDNAKTNRALKPVFIDKQEETHNDNELTGCEWLDKLNKPVYSGSSKKVELIKPKNTEEEDVRKLQELQMKLEAVIGKDLIKTESDMLKKEYKKYSADSIIAETRNAILFGENKVDPVVEALKMLKKKSMEVNRI